MNRESQKSVLIDEFDEFEESNVDSASPEVRE